MTLPIEISSWIPILIYWLLVATMLLGVVGAFIPAIPGPSLIVGAMIIAGFVYGWPQVTTALTVAVVVLVLCFAIEYLAGILGGQKAGASHWGQIGSMVGLGLGVFGLLPALPLGGPVVGIFLGPFVGAVAGELLYLQKEGTVPGIDRLQKSLKAGIGIVVGSVLGLLMQGLLSLFALGVFLSTTFSNGVPH